MTKMKRPKKALTWQSRRARPGVPGASSEAALQRMKRQRTFDTLPELELRRSLHKLGLRFRVNTTVVTGVRRRADVIFGKYRVAVFVDGCFWHGCPRHGTWPKANSAFWQAKIRANQKRDADTNQKLLGEGWTVVRVWERADLRVAAARIAALVREMATSSRPPRVLQLADLVHG